MLAKEITIGMQARVKVGNRLAIVTVHGKANQSGGRRQAWWCRTEDTGRMIAATAARLRPMPGTPEAAAEKSRKLAAERRRIATTPAGTFAAEPAAPELVPPHPVPGMFAACNQSRLIERLAAPQHMGAASFFGEDRCGLRCSR
jgi:hypothetical protein